MKVETILQQLDTILESEKINHIQEQVFVLSWQGNTYEKIAQKTGYDRDYVKDVGCRLWQKLSQKFGTKVTKRNLRTVWRQYTEQKPQVTIKNKSKFNILDTKMLNCSCDLSETIQDWGEAINVSFFVGRERELKTLKNWILLDKCHLITLVGIGGIGKTATSIKLAQNIKAEFQYVFWRSLRNTPKLEELLVEIVKLIDRENKINLPKSIHGLIKLVIKYLKINRCLLIFDNAESILCNKSRAGKYKSDCELYGEFFAAIAESNHQSCLIITSRERIVNLEIKEGQLSVVKSLQLLGLSTAAANSILHHQRIAECPSLTNKYRGNPLALKIAATTIKSIFGGDANKFLAQKTAIYGDIWDLVSEQFNRLTELEQTIMYWLAINREMVTLSEFQSNIFPKVTNRKIITAIESLKRRSLIEVNNTEITQHPVIMEYINELILERTSSEKSLG